MPVSLLEIRGESGLKKIVIGVPADPKLNHKNTSDFFFFQMNYSQEMLEVRNWVEESSDLKWIAVGWKDDLEARRALLGLM